MELTPGFSTRLCEAADEKPCQYEAADTSTGVERSNDSVAISLLEEALEDRAKPDSQLSVDSREHTARLAIQTGATHATSYSDSSLF
jgi:hypothetical protein